jgi:hypothetical protein
MDMDGIRAIIGIPLGDPCSHRPNGGPVRRESREAINRKSIRCGLVAGALSGGFIGSFPFLVVGTLVGGLVGALTGAVAGRVFASSFAFIFDTAKSPRAALMNSTAFAFMLVAAIATLVMALVHNQSFEMRLVEVLLLTLLMGPCVAYSTSELVLWRVVPTVADEIRHGQHGRYFKGRHLAILYVAALVIEVVGTTLR